MASIARRMVSVAWRTARRRCIFTVAWHHGTPRYTLGICRDKYDGDENHSLLNPEHPLISFYSVPVRYAASCLASRRTFAMIAQRFARIAETVPASTARSVRTFTGRVATTLNVSRGTTR